MSDIREVTVDLRGLKCPLPALRTLKALRAASADETLLVLADDPLAAIDIPNAAREFGAQLLDSSRDDGALQFRIRVIGFRDGAGRPPQGSRSGE
ncbi:sulfurtransferase TusA family protein [Hansschlegelia sp.]|uniref:sulfurtransferase TusA family protein n=1 Tax=Hansschlegelia sp. TaxID=2041892 RepID=UPI002BF4E1AC|nr:sulfurtransferase TusA family protein [Hansschlegelia sp.]HVI29354.1 sulfurtransferase TusA family protein [Hansschlegelia sp.]